MREAEIMEQITVLVKDVPGALAYISEVLGRNEVNIKAIFAEGLAEGYEKAGVIQIITDELDAAKQALKSEGLKFSVSEIINIRLLDKPSELGKVSRKLGDEGIYIQYIYIIDKEDGHTDIAMKVSDVERARVALEKYII
jgi:hypothetical protein